MAGMSGVPSLQSVSTLYTNRNNSFRHLLKLYSLADI